MLSNSFGMKVLYLDTCRHTPSERDLGHIWVLTQELARGSSTLHHVEKPWGYTSLTVDLCQHHHGDRREGRRLEDHGIT